MPTAGLNRRNRLPVPARSRNPSNPSHPESGSAEAGPAGPVSVGVSAGGDGPVSESLSPHPPSPPHVKCPLGRRGRPGRSQRHVGHGPDSPLPESLRLSPRIPRPVKRRSRRTFRLRAKHLRGRPASPHPRTKTQIRVGRFQDPGRPGAVRRPEHVRALRPALQSSIWAFRVTRPGMTTRIDGANPRPTVAGAQQHPGREDFIAPRPRRDVVVIRLSSIKVGRIS